MRHYISVAETAWKAMGIDRETFAHRYAAEFQEGNTGSVHAPSDWRPINLLRQDVAIRQDVDVRARRMLAYYSPSVAQEKAFWFAMSQGPNTDTRILWLAVEKRIREIGGLA